MNNYNLNLSCGMNGAYEGSTSNTINNNYCKNVIFYNTTLINNKFIDYNNNSGIFNIRKSGVYSLYLPINVTSQLNNDINAKLCLISVKKECIACNQFAIKSNTTSSNILSVYFYANSGDTLKINLKLSQQATLSYSSNIIINYSLWSI